MKILKIRIQGQEAVWENPFEIVSGSQNYLYIKPDFSSEWNGLDVKFLFRDRSGNEVWNSETNTNVSDGTDGLIRIPASIISGPFFVIGVLGYGAENKFVPTASLKIDVTDDGYDAFSKVNGVSEEEKERLAELVLSDFKVIMDSYAETMAEYGVTMNEYSANEEARKTAETERQNNELARINAESLRQGAESGRVSAEGERVLAEEGREASEESRKNAENERSAYEDTRVINEQARVIAENDRQDAEDKRASAESKRENGEDQRAGAEVERLSAERERKEAEVARKTAEEARVSRENIREENEASREIAEGARIQAENQRVLAENQRVTAETQRATKWQEMSSDIEKAVEDANNAAAECGEATENAKNVAGLMANALKGSAYGQNVTLDDISPVEHTLDVKVKSKNIYPFPLTKCRLPENGTIISSSDNEVVAKGASGVNPYMYGSGWLYFYRDNVNYTGAIDFTKDIVTVSMDITLVEEGVHGATFKISPITVTGGTVFTATTTTTRFSFTISVSTLTEQGLYVALNANTLKIENIQFEYGTEATEYTPYMADVSDVWVEVTDDSGRYEETLPTDGTMEVISSYPSMTIRAMNSGAVVDVTYNKDINKAFLESQNKIAELEEKLTNAIISLGGNV